MNTGKTSAVLSNFENSPGVNDLLVISESRGSKTDLIDLIIFVKYIEVFELLFFKYEIIISIFPSSQVKNRMT